MEEKSRIRDLLPTIWNKKCFRLIHLMFLLIFASLLQVSASPYIMLSEDETDLSSSQQQQSNPIAGKFTDSQSGEAMPCVNIHVKGTTIGAVSDAEGKYSLTLADTNATMEFSFIGHKCIYRIIVLKNSNLPKTFAKL